MINAPQPWPGTAEEIDANRRTHQFDAQSGRCWQCDCRPWGITAEWPCGTEPPRVEMSGDEYARRTLPGIIAAEVMS